MRGRGHLKLVPGAIGNQANPPKRLHRCPARGEISEMRREAQVSPKASEDRRGSGEVCRFSLRLPLRSLPGWSPPSVSGGALWLASVWCFCFPVAPVDRRPGLAPSASGGGVCTVLGSSQLRQVLITRHVCEPVDAKNAENRAISQPPKPRHGAELSRIAIRLWR